MCRIPSAVAIERAAAAATFESDWCAFTFRLKIYTDSGFGSGYAQGERVK